MWKDFQPLEWQLKEMLKDPICLYRYGEALALVPTKLPLTIPQPSISSKYLIGGASQLKPDATAPGGNIFFSLNDTLMEI